MHRRSRLIPPVPPPDGTFAHLHEICYARTAGWLEAESFCVDLEADINAVFGGISMDISFSFIGDYQDPDRMQGTAVLSLGFFAMESQIVTIGDTTYAADPETGEWDITPSPDLLLLDPLDPVGTEGPDSDDFADLTLVGAEELEGVQTCRLAGSAPANAFEGTEGQAPADLWVGVEDSLIWWVVIEMELNFEVEGAPGLAGQISGTAELAATISISDYGASVVIEAPVVAGDVGDMGDVTRGMEVANEQGCSGCHTTDGTVLVGPSRMGLFGRDEELEDGTAVTVDAAYIEESIKDPAARITKGFTNT